MFNGDDGDRQLTMVFVLMNNSQLRTAITHFRVSVPNQCIKFILGGLMITVSQSINTHISILHK